METNNRNNELSFEAFIALLRMWVEESENDRLDEGHNNAPHWGFSRNGKSFVINKDTKKDGARTFISNFDKGMEIRIIPSNGKRKKMTCGEESIRGLYIYEN